MITILDVAVAWGAKRDEHGAISAEEFDRLDLPFFSGCQYCEASLGPYNAYPTKTGFISCKDCAEEMGYADVPAFEAENKSTKDRSH
jgi:hypothetical protein